MYRRALLAGVMSAAVALPAAAVPVSGDAGVELFGAAPAEAAVVTGHVWAGAPVQAAPVASARRLEAAAAAQLEAAVAKRAASVAATRAAKRAQVIAGKRAQVVAAARSKVGMPYRWGAAGPRAYDCSGLALTAFRAAGVKLPHNAAAQTRRGRSIPRSQVRPGDGAYYGGPAYHAAVVVEVKGGRIYVVDALNPGTGVGVRRANYAGSPRFFRFIG